MKIGGSCMLAVMLVLFAGCNHLPGGNKGKDHTHIWDGGIIPSKTEPVIRYTCYECGATKDGKMVEMTFREFIKALGGSVQVITAMPSDVPGVHANGAIANVFGVAVSGYSSSSIKFPSSLQTADLSGINTSKMYDMEYMFSGCSKLTTLDVSGFDTSGVYKGMNYMFSGCKMLTSLDVSGFDTTWVNRMDYMFSSCDSLTGLDVSGFTTAKVTTMGSMFSGCSSLPELDVTSFDTSAVTSMSSMFSGCSSLQSINVSNFNTSKVGSPSGMNGMFSDCSNLTELDLSSFDTLNAYTINYMFRRCSKLQRLNLTSFDTSRVNSPNDIFLGTGTADSPLQVYVSSKWTINKSFLNTTDSYFELINVDE